MDSGINVVLSCDGMRNQEIHDFTGREASVSHSSKDFSNRISGLRDSSQLCRHGYVGTASEELNTRPTDAIGNTDGAGKLDAKRYSGYKSLKRSRQ